MGRVLETTRNQLIANIIYGFTAVKSDWHWIADWRIPAFRFSACFFILHSAFFIRPQCLCKPPSEFLWFDLVRCCLINIPVRVWRLGSGIWGRRDNAAGRGVHPSGWRQPVATTSKFPARPGFSCHMTIGIPLVAERLPEGSHGHKSMEPSQSKPLRRVATSEPVLFALRFSAVSSFIILPYPIPPRAPRPTPGAFAPSL